MKCIDIKPYLFDFVVGELDPDIEIQVHEHLGDCSSCRSFVEELEAVTSPLKISTRFEPAPGVYRRVRTVLPRKRPRRVFSWLPVSAGYALAAFLLGAAITHTADTIALRSERAVEREIQYEPPGRMPYADTVEFYTVPVKNLVRS